MNTSLIATNLPLGVGVMLVGSGLYGVAAPLDTIRHFGLPWAQEPHSRIYPAVAVRNLSAGIATIIMSMRGQREATGILLSSWTLVGLVDTRIVSTHGVKVATRAINTIIVALVGALAWQEGKGPTWIDQALTTAVAGMFGALLVNSWILS